MSEINIRIEIEPAAHNFSKFTRKTVLGCWKIYFGWHRFFVADWWRIVFGLPLRETTIFK